MPRKSAMVPTSRCAGAPRRPPADALVTIEGSAIDDNASTGVDVEGVASVVVGLNHSTIARNGTHDIVQGSTTIVRTFGNNALTGDGASDVSGSLSPVTAK
jgi:hypothetical protein